MKVSKRKKLEAAGWKVGSAREERKDLMREVLAEALEDVALARAIEEGEQSALVTRDEVSKALDA